MTRRTGTGPAFAAPSQRRRRNPALTTRGARWSPEVRHLVLLLLLASASVLAGLKPLGISRDLDNYRVVFEWAIQADWSELLAANDPLYHAASRLIWMMGGGFTTFMLVIAFATCIAKAVAFKELDADRGVLLLLYFSYLFWLHEYTQVRLALGLGLVLFGMYRPSRSSWILFIVAALVHGSTLLIVALHMARNYRRAATLTIVICLMLVFMTGYAEDAYLIVITRVTVHLDLLDAGEVAEINLFSLLPLIQGAILLASIRHLAKLPAMGHEEFGISCLGFASFYALSFVPVLAFRVHELLIPFFLIYVSRVWRHSKLVQLGGVLYVLVGIRTTFLSADSLLFAGVG